MAEYQLKCKQMEIENKQIEIEKIDILEAYAKYWGHYNDKQKIKYTGRLIKDIDSITQVINIIFSVKIIVYKILKTIVQTFSININLYLWRTVVTHYIIILKTLM